MASQEEVRRVSIYINGNEADLTFKQLQQGASKLYNELVKLTPGTEAFRQKAMELKEVKGVVEEIREEINATGGAFEKIKQIAEGTAIGTLVSRGIETAIESVKEFIAGSEEAYAEAQRTQTQLQVTLKATGGVAGESQEKLEKLQQTLMNQTGVDDDVIAKGESMLLTFTNIRGKIYDQAMPAVVNLTAALNQGKVSMEGIQSTAQLLGKALDNPTNAAKALRSMNITLTEAEKEQINTMMRQNDMMGAQQLIINEVNKRYGNLAETLANTDVGVMQKFETRIGNLQENFGKMIESGKVLSAQLFDPFLSFLEKATSTSLPEKIAQEHDELNTLVGAIVSCNNNQAVRNQLVSELQAKYPDFLGNIKAEDAANDLLLRRLQQVNDQYRQRIFIATNEEKIKEIQESRNKAIKEEAEARERVAKASGLSATALAKLNDEQVKGLAQEKLEDERRISNFSAGQGTGGANVGGSYWEDKAMNDVDLIVNGRKRIEDSFKQEADLMNANAIMQQKVTDQQVKDIDIEIAALQKKKAAEKDAAKADQDQLEIDRLNQKKKQLLGIVDKPTAGPSASDKAKEEEARRKIAEFIQQSKELTQRYNEFNGQQLASLLATNDKEVKDTELKYDKMINDEKNFIVKAKQNKYANHAEIQQHQDQVDALIIAKDKAVKEVQEKQQKELVDKIIGFTNQMNGKLEIERDKEIDQINKFFDDQKKAAGDNAAQQALIEQGRQKALTDAKLREVKRFKTEKDQIEASGVGDAQTKDQLEIARINKKYDDEIAALKLKYSAEIQATKEFQEAIDAINKQRHQEIKASNKSDAADRKNLEIQAAQEVSNMLFTISRNNRQNELNDQIKNLEDRRNQELANKNLTEDQKNAINKKYDAQEKQLKLQAWKADKQASLEQAVINGALAVIKALPNPFTAAAAGIAAAAQIGIIAAQEPPQFEHGGYSSVDYSKPSGWVKRPTLFANSASGRPFIAGEGNKTEYIISSQQLKDPVVANFVGMIEANRGVKMFENGGYSNRMSSSVGASSATHYYDSDRLDRIEMNLDRLHNIVHAEAVKPVIWYNRAMVQEQSKIVNIQTKANA